MAAGIGITSGASAAEPTSTITVVLKAPHQSRLDRLAMAHGLTHAQRVAALARVVPSAAARASVVDSLHAQGFRVTHQTAWTVDAAAPDTTIADTFGARSANLMTRMPAAISSVTAAVLANSNGAAIFHAQDACTIYCHDGQDFRNAYSSPSSVLRKGNDANGPLTIATIQLPLGGGWNQSDLTTYAGNVGLPDPVSSGQYQQFAVDGVAVPPATKTEGNADEEVDLDQESILSTAPTANQRAYFDTNATVAGYADSLSQVLADVTQGTGAINGGDPKIVALSTSWGTCESEFSDSFAFPHDTIAALGNILKSLTAAGVTVFAASGDDGVYDCGDSARSTKVAVDYPASDPSVVGVGGTRLQFVGNSAANDGTNWTDTGWQCVSAETCQGVKNADTGGSGGGESSLFAMPKYQSLGIGHDRFKTSTGKRGNFGTQPRRLVPDIASDGDPDTGFATLTSDPVDAPTCANPVPPLFPCKPKTLGIGGTSLSAPTAAAMFTDLLAAHGATAGVGDIHGALYSAYASHRGVFRDPTTGSNGAQADVDARATAKKGAKTADLPVDAQPGYDTVTGLGTVLWPALSSYLFGADGSAPALSLTLAGNGRGKHGPKVRATWTATLPKKNGSLSSSANVVVTVNGVTKPIIARTHATPTGSVTFRGKPGHTYQLTVAEQNFAKAPAPASTTRFTVPVDDTAFTFHGAWMRVADKSDFGGSHEVSATRGDHATITATGATYEFTARTGPSYGKIAAFHGGTKLGEFDLYSAKPGHRTFALFGTGTTPVKSRTFRFSVAGHKDPRSTGTAIDLDSFSAES